MNYRFLRFASLLIGLLLFSYAISLLPSFSSFNQAWVDQHTRDNGLNGIVQYVAVATFLLSIGLPRQLVAFMGGYAFGFAEGFVYSTLAATLSCAIVVTISRYLAKPVILHKFEARVNKFDNVLLQSPVLSSIVIRLLPIGNNLLTNIFAGVSKMSTRAFIVGSAIGYMPQMAVFALMGKGIVVNSELKITLSIALLTLSSLLSAYIYKVYRHQQLDQTIFISLNKNHKRHSESDELRH